MIDALWSEFFVILLVALIFLGPQEMLVMLRTLGQWLGKMQKFMHHIKLAAEYEAFHDARVKQQDDQTQSKKDTP
ncbi:MAG: hypothetical protein Q8K36_04595 [Alphaproteobacteria bacterium]|nr:hypothetical protein [Alphaproteobacteria bacterium]